MSATELQLDFTPAARASDPETSHLAAEKVAPTVSRCRALALLALDEHGPMHDFRLAVITGLKQTSVGVRRKELCTAGLVERAPCKPKPNADGNLCIVWQVTEAGKAQARALREGERGGTG